MDLFRTKSVENSLADTHDPEFQLNRNLTALELTVFGIGVIIGAGIFTLTGTAAALYAGPAVVFSFVLAAICCGLAAPATATDIPVWAGESASRHRTTTSTSTNNQMRR